MHIAHYHPHIWGGGGIATYLEALRARQAQQGHQASFFQLDVDQNRWSMDKPDTHGVQDEADLCGRMKRMNVDLLHLHGGMSQEVPESMDVVRTLHGHGPYCPSGTKFLKRTGQPCQRRCSVGGCATGLLLDRCGSVRPANLLKRLKQFRNDRRLTSRVPTMTMSQYVRDQMIRHGFPSQLVTAIPIPAPELPKDDPPPPSEQGQPRFLFMGRLHRNKGMYPMVEAFARMNVPAILDLAGIGDEELGLREHARQLGVSDRICFHGWVGPDERHRLLTGCRAVVFPSLWQEPAGLVSHEAASHARAVVASRVGGIPEFVRDGTTGLLVEPGDVPGLARSMDELGADRDRAAVMGRQGLDRARRLFTVEAHAEKVESVYHHARRRAVT